MVSRRVFVVATFGEGGSVLGPLEEFICTAPYELSQGDVDAGGVHNQATVTVDYVLPTSDKKSW